MSDQAILIILFIIFCVVFFMPNRDDIVWMLISKEATEDEMDIISNANTPDALRKKVVEDIVDRLIQKGELEIDD